MKNTRIIAMAFVMVFASLLNTSAQTADELIQKHVDAVGGLENWKKINSIKLTGSMMEKPVKLTTLGRFKLTRAGRMKLTTLGRSKLTTPSAIFGMLT